MFIAQPQEGTSYQVVAQFDPSQPEPWSIRFTWYEDAEAKVTIWTSDSSLLRGIGYAHDKLHDVMRGFEDAKLLLPDQGNWQVVYHSEDTTDK
jgi:hypothetical protein